MRFQRASAGDLITCLDSSPLRPAFSVAYVAAQQAFFSSKKEAAITGIAGLVQGWRILAPRRSSITAILPTNVDNRFINPMEAAS